MVYGALLLVLAGCAKSPPAPYPAPPPPPIYRIASGSPAVLAQYPRGTQLTLQTEICLKAGEQVTITGSNGQTVTYNRPGCMRRNAVPTPQNAGGFTFGWAAPSGASAPQRGK